MAVVVMAWGGGLAPGWGKTIDEAEPRTPISSLPYTISQAGSYYLTTDLVQPKEDGGITVSASDVTIDLQGFSLVGPGKWYWPMCNGINILRNLSNVEVCNGTVRQWPGSGICAEDPNAVCRWDPNDPNCIVCPGRSHRVVNVRATENLSAVYLDGAGHLVKDCTCLSNLSGVILGQSCTITGNTLQENGGVAIDALAGSTITGNTCGMSWDGHGIIVAGGCLVQGNTLLFFWQGIQVFGDGSLIKNNTIRDTLTGIYVAGRHNAIEENLVTSAETGIDFAGTGNFYANNRCFQCQTYFGQNVPVGPGDGGGNVGF